MLFGTAVSRFLNKWLKLKCVCWKQTLTRDVEGVGICDPSVPPSGGIIPQYCMSEFCRAMSKLAVVLNLSLLQNVRLLRSELQKLGESLQSAERACCHSTSAGKLREALCTCDDILARQVTCLFCCGLQGDLVYVLCHNQQNNLGSCSCK